MELVYIVFVVSGAADDVEESPVKYSECPVALYLFIIKVVFLGSLAEE